MASNFFTNEEENTLKNRINAVLHKDKNIEYLDFLIGYFRITGFDKISDSLSDIKHTRILVGINADKNTYEASQLIKEFAEEQVEIYNQKPLDAKEYANFASMKNLIIERKIEVKISADKNVHSKMYIMRDNGVTDHTGQELEYQGRVIIGSSNLTHNGLEANTEINAELKDDKSLKDAVKVFEKLWADSVELTEEDFDTQILPKLKEPPMEKADVLTPYFLYIKALQVYFGERVNVLEFSEKEMPKNFKSFKYQSDAVQDGLNKLNKYNGFYLADVVGLGKTIIAILMIKVLKLQTLIVAPNAVLNQWRKAIEEFNIANISCVSKDNIPDTTTAELIVVDEAHNFRNSDTNRYEKLQTICKYPHQKRVILLSATPQNNEPIDIANQIYLFQNQNASNIPNLTKLKEFFDQQNKKYKEIISDNSQDNSEELNAISKEIKEKVLKYIMTRRTRTDIETHSMYRTDIDGFPQLEELKPLEYDLKSKNLTLKYNKTSDYLQTRLEYARFKALNKLNGQGKAKYKILNPHMSDNIFDDNPLATLMKIQLVKRFESSFEAFKISIARHTRRLEAFIRNFENDTVYLGDQSNEFLDGTRAYYIEENRVKYKNSLGVEKTLKGHIFSQDDFEDDFLKLLQKDLTLFKALQNDWKDENSDPKFEVFKQELKKYTNNEKIVVFTESKDTGKYLNKQLNSENLKILYVDSDNRNELMETIALNFDANYDKTQQKNDYNIIITTDTLAEGINLHRSSTIYNYDIPWNATKLMQRIGRINRIGSVAKSYNVYNFKPISKSEEIIGLSHKAHTKLQSFHATYGEDNKIYTDKEHVVSKELFEIVEEQQHDEVDEELQFLQELRAFRNHSPKQYALIESLESDLQVSVCDIPSSYSYKKSTQTDRFYRMEQELKELDFVSFATELKQLSNSKASDLDQKSVEELQSAIDRYYHENNIVKEKMQRNDSQSTKQNTEAIKVLKTYAKQKIIEKELFKRSKTLVEEGVYANLSKEILKSTAENIQEILQSKKSHTTKQSEMNFEAEEMQYIVTYTKGI